MRFTLSEQLLAELRAMQVRRGCRDQACVDEDAFLLDPGLGPSRYLTADGRILLDEREPHWVGDCLREATDEACGALVVGAKKTGINGLRALVPPCPETDQVCQACNGRRWWTLTSLATVTNEGGAADIVCPICNGRGWLKMISTTSDY